LKDNEICGGSVTIISQNLLVTNRDALQLQKYCTIRMKGKSDLWTLLRSFMNDII
jgi:hypothetical protein